MVVLFVCFCSVSFAGETPQYVGAKKCEGCHSEQFAIWSKSPHAKTYEILGSGSDKVKSNMKTLNVTENPQEAPACLECHVAGFGKTDSSFTKSYDRTEGITCESCHGPGSLYRKAMLSDEEKYAADPKTTVAEWEKLGLVKADEKRCKTCHSYDKNFNFSEKFKKIAHPGSHQ